MAMGWAHPTTGPNQHHKTGTRLEPPSEAQMRPSNYEKKPKLNFAHMGSPGAKPSTKHRTAVDGKLQLRPYVSEGTKRIK